MLTKFKALVFIPLFLFISNTGFAGDFWPMQVGNWYEFDKHDSANPPNEWTVRMEVLNTVTIGAHDYFLLGEWNYNIGEYNEIPLRFTDTAAYYYNGTNDTLVWQAAAVGTTWSVPEEDGQNIREIISIETVTVPYGTFDNAYVFQNYTDYDDPTRPNSGYWYEYVVPGVGMVKEVDAWNSDDNTTVAELARVGVAPEPVSSTLFLIGGATLGFRRFWNKRKAV